MDTLLVILRRHAGGAPGFGYKAILYLIDSGIYTAKKNQDTDSTGFTGLGESLELLADEMEIYAHKDSLEEHKLREEDFIEGVKIDDGEVLKNALKNAKTVMIY
jgi:sulfur relay (sulfurtransferase) DsrF/TusC family protein